MARTGQHRRLQGNRAPYGLERYTSANVWYYMERSPIFDAYFNPNDSQSGVLVFNSYLDDRLTLAGSYTRVGKAMQAVSYNQTAAALMGISVDRIITFTFMLGSMLAAAAGVLVALKDPKIEPYMGLLPGLKAFVAAVLGGIGNVPGAVVGGLVMGIAEVMVVGYVSPTYRDAIAFVLLILILLVRPSGILGRHVAEKV